MSWIARVYNWVTDRDNGVPITASRMDAEFDNIITGLNNCITADGSNPPTADIPWGNHKITGLATPTNSTDAATKGYVDSPLTHVIAYTNSSKSVLAAGGKQQFYANLELGDVLAEFTADTVNPFFTAQNAGYYIFNIYQTVFLSLAGDVTLHVEVNAVAEKMAYHQNLAASKYYTLSLRCMLLLAATDVVKFYIEPTQDLTLNPDIGGTPEPKHLNGIEIVRVK